MHPEQPGGIGRGFLAVFDQADDLLLLLGFQLLPASAERPSLRAALSPAFVRSRSTSRSNSANDPTICIIMSPAGVVVSMASVRLRSWPWLSDTLHDYEDVLQRAREAVELPDHDDIALADLSKQAMQFRAIPSPT